MLALALMLALARGLQLPVRVPLRLRFPLVLGLRQVLLCLCRGDVCQAKPCGHTAERATEEHAPERAQHLTAGPRTAAHQSCQVIKVSLVHGVVLRPAD